MEANPPDQKPRPKGGPAYHREGCRCNPCKARRRASEALALANGEGRDGLEAQSQTLTLESNNGSHIARGHIANWIKLKAEEPDLTNADIARRLGIATKTLNNHIYRARKEGWLTFEDPLEEIEFGIIPKAVKGLDKLLSEQDKVAIIETMKGVVFKQFLESKGISQNPTNILAIKLELPEMGETQIVSGKIVGKPKTFIEAEVVDGAIQVTETEAIHVGEPSKARTEVDQ